jgi:hypothetical protein
MRHARLQRAAGAICALLCAAVLPASPVCAQGVAKSFSHTIKAGGIAEECFELAADASIGYAFEAAGPVDFNIHFHRGNDVEYPVRSAQVRQADGRFVAPSRQEYCLMWTNRTPAPLALHGMLSP